MSISLADARYLFERLRGLFHRGMISLRTRGWRATWIRLRRHWSPTPVMPPLRLYRPADTAFTPFDVPCASDPVASIIIPVYNQAAHTVACLRALAEHPPRVAIEILVVDDGSSDSTFEWMPAIRGLRYVRRELNGGFIAACNDGADRARGQFLVFLNNDTIPQPGWLDALLDTFRTQADAGLAGSQLIYPDGRLQEAGGVVFSDGSAWNYGRFDSPLDPRYTSVRAADYCSGAALAIPAALFRQLGGFDARYAPAYYEDTDLAFAVRAAGYRVFYQPRSRVVHLEGVTSGTDTSGGVKAYQLRNRTIFADKWRASLAHQPSPAVLPTPSVLAGKRPQVLIIDSTTPRPQRDSGSLRACNLMRLLIEEGAHVVFFPADLAFAGEDTEQLRAMGVEVWHAPFAEQTSVWLREHGARFSTIMVSRHYVASSFIPLLRQHSSARILFDTVDLHYLRERRSAELSRDAALLRAAERTRAAELRVIAQSDVTLVVSPLEREVLSQEAKGSHVAILSNLHELSGRGKPFGARRDLVFVGGFHHPPNTDAVRWFLHEVFPRIRTRLADVEFHCIGDQPPDDIRAFDGQAGVHVHGHVPELAPYMEGVRLAVAPLRFGAGVKGKVNLSMAHGQPVIATSCAVEGMHLRDGEDVLVADDARAFADAVIRAYEDASLWETLSVHGLENVRRHFSLDQARPQVRKLFGLV